jgi:hypothetical protein
MPVTSVMGVVTLDEYGYYTISINNKTEYMHRYVYRFYNGDIPNGYVVRHTCDNPLCINPNHLIIGTPADNVNDMVMRNRSCIGSSNGRSKLSEEQVINIFYNTNSIKSIADTYNVDPKTIRKIKNKEMWINITRDL